jgi:DnaJ-class molecular chaperone|tara:strand:- start:2987 stop:3823 length:837 start_codon:yes stop_codon:yes gene_type:complete
MDYYNVLGVSKSASQPELKNAFKKKAMQYHPDKGGDPEKFKQINEAYQNLSDPQKRQMYDQFGTTDPQQAQPQGFNFQGGPGGIDINDIMGQFGFNMGFGNRQMKNQDITIGCNITVEEVYSGKNVIATYRLNNGKEQTVDIKVPRGVNNGDRIRYGGMGQQDIQGLPHGDLFVIINIVNTGNFQLNGDDLLTTRKVGVLDLIVGLKINVDLPDKSAVMLNIPKGTQPNTVFSINGRGLPNRKTGRSGSVLVKIIGTTPDNLDEQQLQDIEQMRKKIS